MVAPDPDQEHEFTSSAFVYTGVAVVAFGSALGAMFVAEAAPRASLVPAFLDDLGAFVLLLLAAGCVALLDPDNARRLWSGVVASGAVVATLFLVNTTTALVAFAVVALINVPLVCTLMLQALWDYCWVYEV